MQEFKSFFKTVEGNEGQKCHYPTRLDTYGCGCSHDCKYCYAKSLLEFRNLWHPMDPRVADIRKIEKKIKTLSKGTVLRLGGMTDCFQPCEEEYKVTYNTIKLLNKYGIHYLIVTKSDLVASDEYVSVLDKKLAHIQITVTSTNDDISSKYENAIPSSRRIAAIEKLQSLGYDVAIRVSPFMSEYIDFDILNSVKCDKVIVEFLRVNSFIQKIFDIDYSKYTHKENGYLHLPLKEKKRLLSKIVGFKQLSLCEDCSEAYEYWKAAVNYNPNDCCNLSFGETIDLPIGNRALFNLKKVAFLSSQTAQEGTKQQVLKWIKNNIDETKCLISGFQSPIEKDVLKHVISKGLKAIIVLAGKQYKNCPVELEQGVKNGTLLIVAPYSKETYPSLRVAATERNKYVLSMANEIAIGDISKGGMLEKLLKGKKFVLLGKNK